MDYNEIIRVPKRGLVPYKKECIIPRKMQDRINQVLITESVIKKRIGGLAKQICGDYSGKEDLTLLAVLSGASVFLSDIGREIYNNSGPEIKYESIKVSTYDEEIKKEGEKERNVRIDLVPSDLREQDVIIIEDILDQGFTLSKIKEYMGERGCKSLRFCTLLSKELENPTEEVKKNRDFLDLDYVGFEIPDVWVAGYGIDVAGDFRNLPFVVSVNESFYR